MGAGMPQVAKKISEKGIYVALVVAIVTAGGLFVIAEFLPSWLTPNSTYQELIFLQIPLIGFGEILMVPMMVLEGIFCAQGRVKLMTIIEVIVSWFIAIPIAAILVYIFKYSLNGIVSALVIGYSTGTTILLFFFLRSNWEQLSKIVVKQNAAEGLHYIDTDWDLLPSKVQEAATILGYTRAVWGTNKEPESSQKDWDDLTESEQAAATVLGYNNKSWDGIIDSHKNTELYDDYDFSDLPGAIRQAAEVLGYTQQTWDENGTIPNEGKDWAELTEAEQKAAEMLGITKGKWDDEKKAGNGHSGVNSSLADSGSSNGMKMPAIPEENVGKYDDYDFSELPGPVREAAERLGYTQSIWDKDGTIPNESKDWVELTEAEQKAAGILGITQDLWDKDSDSSSSKNGCATWNEHTAYSSPSRPDESVPNQMHTKNSFTKYGEYDFDELSPEIQNAALVLGFTKNIWNKGYSQNFSPCEGKPWDSLSSKQRSAALALGCGEKKWEKWLEKSQSSFASFAKYSEC